MMIMLYLSTLSLFSSSSYYYDGSFDTNYLICKNIDNFHPPQKIIFFLKRTKILWRKMKTVLEYSGMVYFHHGRNLQKLINYPTGP